MKKTYYQKQKHKKANEERETLKEMVHYLENKWENTVRFYCKHCLEKAFYYEQNNENGYVSDDELIYCSKNKLQKSL